MPVVMFHDALASPDAWRDGLAARIPGLDFRVWPDIGDPGEIEFAMVWDLPPGSYAGMTGMRCICSLGQGVDHLFLDPDLPRDIAIMRLVDPWMSQSMTEWILLNLLYFHRQGPEYDALARQHRWRVLPPPETSERRVGIMGLGALGLHAARTISGLGFPTAGWARTARQVEGVEVYSGSGQLSDFLARTDVLCCLLPLTPSTRGIINRDTLNRLPRGAFVINAARGAHIVDEDLLAALDSGQVAGAALDVFHTEPLPPEHAYWAHPAVRVWPHVSAQTNPATALDQVAAAIRRVAAGRLPDNLVDPALGY